MQVEGSKRTRERPKNMWVKVVRKDTGTRDLTGYGTR